MRFYIHLSKTPNSRSRAIIIYSPIEEHQLYNYYIMSLQNYATIYFLHLLLLKMSAVTQPGSEPTWGEGLYNCDCKHFIYQKMYVPLRDLYIDTANISFK
jgi:hypothetical protein